MGVNYCRVWQNWRKRVPLPFCIKYYPFLPVTFKDKEVKDKFELEDPDKLAYALAKQYDTWKKQIKTRSRDGNIFLFSHFIIYNLYNTS